MVPFFSLRAWLICLPATLLSLPIHASSFFSHIDSAPPNGILPLNHQLLQLAPGASPDALRLAAQALNCRDPHAERLAVIDYSLPSTEPRLWVFDLAQHELMFQELVSHGQGSGMPWRRRFPISPIATNPASGCLKR